MGYSSDVTDKEWEITLAITAPKKENKTASMDEARNPQWNLLPTQEWL